MISDELETNAAGSVKAGFLISRSLALIQALADKAALGAGSGSVAKSCSAAQVGGMEGGAAAVVGMQTVVTGNGFSADPLTDLLQQGTRQLIVQAVETELHAFLAAHADQTDTDRKSNRMRTIMTQVLGITGLQAVPA